jgi:hypothetical protein
MSNRDSHFPFKTIPGRSHHFPVGAEVVVLRLPNGWTVKECCELARDGYIAEKPSRIHQSEHFTEPYVSDRRRLP